MNTLKLKSFSTAIVTVVIVLLMEGCATNTAGNYRPIVDGSHNAYYETDVKACQQLAEQRSYTNDDVKVNATIGGAIGGLMGAIDDGGLGGALAGAAVGAAIGGGERAWETRDERKAIIIKCMEHRGHRVVG